MKYLELWQIAEPGEGEKPGHSDILWKYINSAGRIETRDSTGATKEYATQEDFDSLDLDFSTDGNFTAGTLKLSRDPNSVKVHVSASASHTSADEVTTAAGFVPVGWRPTANASNCYDSRGDLRRIFIFPDGSVRFTYRNFDGTNLAQTGTGTGGTISYPI